MSHFMNLLLRLLLLSPLPFALCDVQRPFYVIGHMVNDVGLIEPFLDMGSNGLESDVHFSPNGSVKELFHGFPCDLGRRCTDRSDLADFLDKVRELTDSGAKNGYYQKQLVMLFFDMKMGTSGNKTKSAVDVLDHLVEHLWTEDKIRQQEIRVLLYIERERNSDFILSFARELRLRNLDHLSRNIGFDGGIGDVANIRQMFQNLNVTANVWLGNGITNVLRPLLNDTRLGRLLSVRDSSSGFVSKVYDWTVDSKAVMRGSLRLGVDGMITNQPSTLVGVLEEPEFREAFRLATVEDDCFERFVGKTA
ncbi:hypothetical protein JTE90_018368 [Oedothorax gibbosus]|uniref:Uncharacterized protein n=1 Tax=Oedothorax gibbosus TaxID=931172 RepID=A0AAV6UEL9_9ARAC|nr:hypothetical protein JTE90_018368 [Oedothorax gibbosus]